MASYPEGKKETTMWILRHLKEGGTVLDVGACSGIWAHLIYAIDPDVTIDAVEAFAQNVRDHGLESLYRKVYTMDVDDFRYSWYDLIIFGDVIEHMEVEKAQRVLKYAWDRCDDLIVAVPYLYPQDDIYGNPWEVHKQPDLTPEIFAQRYPGMELLWGNNVYGYYHKKR